MLLIPKSNFSGSSLAKASSKSPPAHLNWLKARLASSGETLSTSLMKASTSCQSSRISLKYFQPGLTLGILTSNWSVLQYLLNLFWGEASRDVDSLEVSHPSDFTKHLLPYRFVVARLPVSIWISECQSDCPSDATQNTILPVLLQRVRWSNPTVLPLPREHPTTLTMSGSFWAACGQRFSKWRIQWA